MKILMIGPSPVKAKGGMSTVIQEIYQDSLFEDNCKIDIYESYVDGNKIKRIAFSILSFIKFSVFKINKKYDIYHIHVASYGSTFRKMLYAKEIKKQKKKLILHIHGGQYLDFFKKASEKNKKKILSFLRSADMVIALSEKWKTDFESIMKLQNCVVLENGIDLNKYDVAKKVPQKLSKKFLFLGRVCEDKGIFDLIKAVSIAKNEHSDICIYIGGEGDIAYVNKTIKEFGVENNIKLIGWLNEERKIEMLSKVETLILPSHYEALPMCILEAMACGKAIISTKVGAIPEVIDEDNGILVSVGDDSELAGAIKKCCEDLEWMNKVYYSNLDKMHTQYDMIQKHTQLKKYYEKVYAKNRSGIEHGII